MVGDLEMSLYTILIILASRILFKNPGEHEYEIPTRIDRVFRIGEYGII